MPDQLLKVSYKLNIERIKLFMENKVKIFISYHKKCKIIKSDILEPIQVGRVNADKIIEGIIGDNTGENISAQNPKYCELTAQYWAWKNYDKIGNPDYIGFMHYRRHFIFNENYEPEEKDNMHKYGYSAYVFENLSKNYFSKIYLDDEHIRESVKNTDMIFVKKANMKRLHCKNGREDFIKNCPGSYAEDYDKCMDLIKKLYPEYIQEIKDLNNGPYRYFYNMFIMKREDFFEYSEFLFSILEEYKKEIDFTNYSRNGQRLLGYMGEFILTLFAFKKSKDKDKHIKELYSSFVIDTSEKKNLLPAFKSNNNVIAMSSSNEYVPYLSTCLQSLKEVANNNQNYDCIIFERSITDQNKKILKQQIEQDNISLRFVNPTSLLKGYNLKFPRHYNLECYFRLTSPLILKNFEKVLFTDVDLLFKKDPSVVYNVNISDYPLGACQDFIMGAFLNIPPSKADWRKYCKEELHLDNSYKYFNTGVMLINIKYFNKNNLSEKILKLVSKKQYRILEQDGLNAYFKTGIKYLETSWNFPVANFYYKTILNLMPAYCYEQYEKDSENPSIIHFAGTTKPWFSLDLDYADLWWSYARKTPFYEEILKRMTLSGIPTPPQKCSRIKAFALYWKYRILQNIVSGETKERYIRKKHMYKDKLKNRK